MKRLSKSQQSEQVKHAQAVQAAQDKLIAEIEAYNKRLEELKLPVEAAMESLNEVIADADSWRQDIHAEMQDYLDERSEKWLGSDAGQAYSEWQRSFENEWQPIEVEFPVELPEPELPVAEVIEGLPEEP